MRDALGLPVVFLCCLLFAFFLLRRRVVEIGLAACAYIVSFLVFTNLHIVHNYYQYENGVFAVGILILCVVGLLERGDWHCWAGAALFALYAGCSLYTYHYGPFLVFQTIEDRGIEGTAQALKAQLQPNQVFLLDGLGYSPEIPYYSERRAIMNPNSLTSADIRRSVSLLEPGVLGAAGRCGPHKTDRHPIEQFLASVGFRATSMVDTGACVLYFGQVVPALAGTEFSVPPSRRVRNASDIEAIDGFSEDLELTGFGPMEGPYSKMQIPYVRWGLGPTSNLLVHHRQGPVRLVLKVLCYHTPQSIRVRVDGKELLFHHLAKPGEFETISVPVRELIAGSRIELAYGRWENRTNTDPLERAVLFGCIQLASDDIK